MTERAREHRRYPRIPSTNTLLVRDLSGEAHEGFARTRTLGQGGCGFLSDDPRAPGAEIELLISASNEVVRARARVVYRLLLEDGRYEIGVEFLEMSDDDRHLIEQLCSESAHRE